jgi:cytochrome c551/c552
MFVLLLAVAACGRREAQPAGGKAATGAAENAAAATPAAEAAALDQGPRAADDMVVIAPLAATGQMLFDAKGCTNCHAFGEGDVAPDLRGVTTRRTVAWLRRQITEPEWMAGHDSLTRAMVQQYGAPMADLDVSADEANALLQYLAREDGVR